MISRTDALMQSIQSYIRTFLDANGYSSLYSLEDDHPNSRTSPLDKTIIVLGHDESGEAKDGELGGPLTFEPITFNLDVLGKDHRSGRNISSIIKEKLESGEPIPLYDYTVNPPVVQDYLPYVDGAIHTRIVFPNPFPWQQHWNVVTFTITLEYNRSYL